MSRSYRRPVIKDRSKNGKKSRLCWLRIQKRAIKQYLQKNKYKLLDPDFEIAIPNRKSIVNDYTLCDYIFSVDMLFTRSGYAKLTDGYNKYLKDKESWSRK